MLVQVSKIAVLLPKVIDRHSTAFFVILYVRLTNEWLVRDTGKKIRAGKRSKVMSGKPVTTSVGCVILISSSSLQAHFSPERSNFIILIKRMDLYYVGTR